MAMGVGGQGSMSLTTLKTAIAMAIVTMVRGLVAHTTTHHHRVHTTIPPVVGLAALPGLPTGALPLHLHLTWVGSTPY